MIRLSRLAWARLGYAVGCLVGCVGLGMAVDVAAALMVGGGLLAVSCLLLVEVGELRKPGGGR
ncbi:hypothetical protein N5079_19740 [Planotetraspora sp. A-T 1434]|uniref:hypothetical protein n=1 Tax=Planotetraspora sp. A-T 1434 TaxID=2979219 RepID=UPI0021BE8F38|nr:hypothetical protein [Planotetraspora sp. A-T 1434]MCT9932437.1 hypothetical protein [Planotetraspora sp. A-T 1434]